MAAGGTGKLLDIKNKVDGVKYSIILEQDNGPKHMVKTMNRVVLALMVNRSGGSKVQDSLVPRKRHPPCNECISK